MTGRYDSVGLYHGPDDPRLIVPKRNPALGWTVNVDHRFGPALLMLTGAAALAPLVAAAFLLRN